MRIISLLLCGVLIVACGDTAKETEIVSAGQSAAVVAEVASIATESSETYEEARAAAMLAIQTATEKGHAWNTSDQLVTDAAKAFANGDEARAIALADEARIHAGLASAQADREATAWRDNVISD